MDHAFKILVDRVIDINRWRVRVMVDPNNGLEKAERRKSLVTRIWSWQVKFSNWIWTSFAKVIKGYFLILVLAAPLYFIFVPNINSENAQLIQIKLSNEMLEFIENLPVLMLAMFMGMIGAAIKHTTLKMDLREVMKAEGTEEELYFNASPVLSIFTFVYIGGAMGVFSFLFIKSRIIGALIYESNLPNPGNVSPYGIALLAASAGYFSFELLGYARERLGKIINNQISTPSSATIPDPASSPAPTSELKKTI